MMGRARRVVLHVDDDAANRQLMERIFARYRASDCLVGASSIKDALKKAGEVSPDLAVLDLTLGEGSGEGLMKVLKTQHATPVIIVSGHAEETTRRRLLDLGADAYLAKPIDVQELLVVIERLIGPPTLAIP